MGRPANLAPDAEQILAPVLEWLDAGACGVDVGDLPDRGFCMSYYSRLYVRDYRGVLCKTVYCIAGITVELNRHVFEVPYFGGQCGVGERLWLAQDQALCLFRACELKSGQRTFNDMANLDLITPAVAAATIRRFLATGDIIWEIQK